MSLTPGAGAINTMTNSITSGWKRSFWGVLGQQLALLTHVVIAATGVGVLVASSPVLFNAIRYAGAGYLVYLGLRMLFTKPISQSGDASAAVVPAVSARAMVLRGLYVNLLNPKAIVFFMAFIPQFLTFDRPMLPQYVTIAATVIIVDVIIMWFVFAVAARPLSRFTATVRGQRVLNSVFGSLFVILATVLLLIR